MTETRAPRQGRLNSKSDVCNHKVDPFGKDTPCDNHFELGIAVANNDVARSADGTFTRTGGVMSHSGSQNNGL
ncbi:MAG: hypothetical protein AB8B64_22950 [Granulosicoccus sp.]